MNAAAVPRPISVHILGLRLITDCHPRTKNGCPAHSTTGIDSTSSIQVWAVMLNQPNWWPNMANTVTIMVNGKVHQNRRVKSFNSGRSEEHTSELQSLMRISYAVFCLNINNNNNKI